MGILRCESLYRAELSDFCGVNVPPNDKDAHRMFLMVNQIPFGKTNHGRVLYYGRTTRHKNVRLCPIAAFSFYLQYRLFVTEEFLNFTIDDWCDNSKWFDIKLLVDVTNGNFDKEMKNHSYARHLKEVLQRLGLPLSIGACITMKFTNKTIHSLSDDAPTGKVSRGSGGTPGKRYPSSDRMTSTLKLKVASSPFGWKV